MNKPLVIYHGNCADGFSAAWCFWHKYGDSCEYLGGVYQQAPPDVTGRFVYLVDFSYKRTVVLDMLEQASGICLIDHHKTALDDLAGIGCERRCQAVRRRRARQSVGLQGAAWARIGGRMTSSIDGVKAVDYCSVCGAILPNHRPHCPVDPYGVSAPDASASDVAKQEALRTIGAAGPLGEPDVMSAKQEDGK